MHMIRKEQMRRQGKSRQPNSLCPRGVNLARLPRRFARVQNLRHSRTDRQPHRARPRPIPDTDRFELFDRSSAKGRWTNISGTSAA